MVSGGISVLLAKEALKLSTSTSTTHDLFEKAVANEEILLRQSANL